MPPTRSYAQYSVVLLMFAFSVMNYFDRTIMSIAGPEIMKEFSIAPTPMGAVYSAFVLGYALFMMPGGHVVDMLGPRVALALMGLSAALFTGLTALGGRPGLGALLGVVPALVMVRFLMGLATAPLYPACGRMSANWVSPVHIGRAQGLIIGGSSLGGAISPIVFKGLMGTYGWRASFGIAAATTAALALVWLRYVRDHPSGAATTGSLPLGRKSDKASWMRLLTNRNLALLTASYGAAGYFTYIFYYWIYYYFGQVRHMGYELSARYTTVLFLFNGLMMPLGGWVSDRLSREYGEELGRRIVPFTGMTLAAVLLFAGTLTPWDWATVALMSLAIGCASVCEGPFWAMTISIGGEQVGAACGILNTGSNLGGFVAPLLTPFIASYLGWSWGLYFGCVVVLAGAVACFLVDPRPVFAPSQVLQ